jgi:segregation and condensation protein B
MARTRSRTTTGSLFAQEEALAASEARPFALKNQIEAILYLKGEALELGVIAQLAACRKDDAYEALLELMEDYAHRDSALEVIAIDQGFALQLRESFLPLATEILPPEIGVGAIRTLATIILRGPMSQVDLVELRGANAYHHVAELVEKGFITKQRRQGSRSFWLKVTDKFHRYFSVDELAAAEAQATLEEQSEAAMP